MRIAQVSPLFESVPPMLYGGTERVVSYLTEALVADGHEVTLFASADSCTNAHLVPQCDRAIRMDPTCPDGVPQHIRMVDQVFRCADDFDIIHFHIDGFHFPLAARHATPNLTTLHGRLDLPYLRPIFRDFRDLPFVSISNNQRRPMPWLNWAGTVYHGLPTSLYAPNYRPDDYLAFIGRISPEKRPDRAIAIAKQVGLPLKIAAKVDDQDYAYFTNTIRPLLDSSLIEFVGEIGEGDKNKFLAGAQALLFPIDWPEPFGLVMIEAMACGTPVIGYRCGSIPEVIDEGETGMVVSSLDQAVDAVTAIDRISRKHCRKIFESRFAVERMARDYLSIYERLKQTDIRWRTPTSNRTIAI